VQTPKPPVQTPAAILFDAGGTLVLQDPAALGRRLRWPVDPRAAFEAHYRAMAEYSERMLAGTATPWGWWVERYLELAGYPDPHTGAERIDGGFGLWNLPIPEVAGTVAALRDAGIRVAVVSNSDGSVAGSLETAGLAHLFETIVDSALVGVHKPDPEIFHLALGRLGVEPESAWYVGDSVYHDLGGARAAGLARALLVDPLGLHPGAADRVGSVADLAPGGAVSRVPAPGG
jgi:putative hydrolase of the HAD superfamily